MKNDTTFTKDGYFTLKWDFEKSKNLEYTLEVASDEDFNSSKVIYKGPDHASFRSGLKNGTYYFRIKSTNKESENSSRWSETHTAIVEHHPLSLAYGLLSIGSIVFLSTVALIVIGVRTTKTEEL